MRRRRRRRRRTMSWVVRIENSSQPSEPDLTGVASESESELPRTQPREQVIGPECTIGTSESCVVCLETFVEGEAGLELACKHGYHEACIRRWLHSKGTCPVCRLVVAPSVVNRRPDALAQFLSSSLFWLPPDPALEAFVLEMTQARPPPPPLVTPPPPPPPLVTPPPPPLVTPLQPHALSSVQDSDEDERVPQRRRVS